MTEETRNSAIIHSVQKSSRRKSIRKKSTESARVNITFYLMLHVIQ